MMDAFRPLAATFEWGGLICKAGSLYWWTRPVTNGDSGFVDVDGQVSCSETAAHVHLHTVNGETTPSYLGPQNDYAKAIANPDLLFYLSAPNADRRLGFRFIRYKHSPPALPVQDNTCWWGGDQRGWEKRVNGVVVGCGAP